MCTVTVCREPERLLVTMNRDELRTRAPETPPEITDSADSAAWIGPRDSERSGTWMGLNACGTVACLLNGNVPIAVCMEAMAAGAPSRGELVPQALSQGHGDAVRAWLRKGLDPTPYPPFMLVVAWRDHALAASWWGHGDLEMAALPAPWALVTSTHWKIDLVLAKRRKAFEAWCADGRPFHNELPAYHLVHDTADPTWAPLMDRGFSRTRSITQGEVCKGKPVVTMRYGPVAGVEAPLLETFLLPAAG